MSDISQSINTGIDLLKNGNFPDALELFQGLYHEYPDNTDVLYNFGVCLNELRDFVGASRILKQLIVIDPVYKNGKVALGFSYINMSKMEEARKGEWFC